MGIKIRPSKVISLYSHWRDLDPTPEPLKTTTGHLFEWETIGECRVKSDCFMSYWPAVDLVTRSQKSSPYRPACPDAQVFHSAVAAALGVNKGNLGMYTAIGSPLDRYYQVDGFFKYQRIIVTFDLTKNPHKDTTRAMVLVTALDVLLGFREASGLIAGVFKRALAHPLYIERTREIEKCIPPHRWLPPKRRDAVRTWHQPGGRANASVPV